MSNTVLDFILVSMQLITNMVYTTIGGFAVACMGVFMIDFVKENRNVRQTE